jgi:hypothetical protein
MPELKLTFEWDGQTVHKETTGFTGKDCESLTSFIEKALGGKETKRTRKAEFNAPTEDKFKKKAVQSGLFH